ncbi:hypothetical protein [Bradyrhizobium yuanmingense]|uniref:hypothetical protein n=1 Tax=Bradyrhizobium yuanmingense TaxID=108015 RepID=UPI000945A048|nr:hypothetical protein [Bradyrhizobium yuanmingense]
MDFEQCGLTAGDRVNLRECAAIEISRLRLELAKFSDAAEEIASLRAQVTIAKNSNGFTLLAEEKAKRLEEENRRLRAEVSRSSYHCD